MQLVVADTGPLRYLVLTGDVALLPKLFEKVLAPQAVYDELANVGAPAKVREWLAATPPWLEIRPDPASGDQDPAALLLDAGEHAAIALALVVGAELIRFGPALLPIAQGAERDLIARSELFLREMRAARRITRDCGARFMRFRSASVSGCASGSLSAAASTSSSVVRRTCSQSVRSGRGFRNTRFGSLGSISAQESTRGSRKIKSGAPGTAELFID